MLRLITILFIAAAMIGGSASAQAVDLNWTTIDCGGSASAGGQFQVVGTIGQHDASNPLTGGGYRLTGGFWPGVLPPLADCPANIVASGASAAQIDIDDLLAVISAWGFCPPPPTPCPANIVTTGASANVVNIDDLLAVISGWGPCP